MEWIEDALATWGPLAVLVGAFVEGEITVTLGGFVAHEGLMSPYAAAGCAFLGSFAADQIVFLLVRRRRDARLVGRLRRWPAFDRAMSLLSRHPTLFILSFRFLIGLRIVGPAAISLAGVDWRRYLALNLVAAAVWAMAFTSLGYFFGKTVEALLGEIGRVEHLALAALALAGLVAVLVRHLRRRAIGPAP